MNISHTNLGTVNKNRVDIGPLTIWFSYQTPVAFRLHDKGGTYEMVRENDWSTTTGKLLNELEPNHKNRIPGEEFKERLGAILARLRLADAFGK